MSAELEMMKSPEDWPMYPYLPVKRYRDGGLPDVGVMVKDGGPRIHHTDALAVVTLPQHLVSLLPAHEYESFDALLADGWQVD